jgi:hypothetical protein
VSIYARMTLALLILRLISAELSYNETRGEPSDGPDRKDVIYYGCKRWKTCETRRPSPPYNPKQPNKCETHRAYMRTSIPAGED